MIDADLGGGLIKNELEALRLLAADLLGLSGEQVIKAIRQGALMEVNHETDNP